MNFLKLLPEKQKQQLIKHLKTVRDGLAQESIETQKMLKVYFNFTQGNATKEEMEEANEQFRDLLRTLGLGAIVILPFSPITIPLIVRLGKKLGIEVIPSSFRNESEEEADK